MWNLKQSCHHHKSSPCTATVKRANIWQCAANQRRLQLIIISCWYLRKTTPQSSMEATRTLPELYIWCSDSILPQLSSSASSNLNPNWMFMSTLVIAGPYFAWRAQQIHLRQTANQASATLTQRKSRASWTCSCIGFWNISCCWRGKKRLLLNLYLSVWTLSDAATNGGRLCHSVITSALWLEYSYIFFMVFLIFLLLHHPICQELLAFFVIVVVHKLTGRTKGKNKAKPNLE